MKTSPASNFRSEPFSERRKVVAAPFSTAMLWTPQKSEGISSKKQQKDFLNVSMESLALSLKLTRHLGTSFEHQHYFRFSTPFVGLRLQVFKGGQPKDARVSRQDGKGLVQAGGSKFQASCSWGSAVHTAAPERNLQILGLES